MSLAAEEVLLLRLSAAVTAGAWDELRALRARGTPDRRWREVLLQAHLFSGFPRVVEAWGVLTEAGDLGALDPDEVEPGAPVAPFDRGRKLFDAIYGAGADAVRRTLDAHHPELARWIEQHAYARVLARPGLSPRLRELCAVVALAVQDQERQLASHARGAVRVGASAEEVRVAIESVEDLIPAPALERMREVVAAFARVDA